MKDSRFELRLSGAELALIKESAVKEGKSTSQFIIDRCTYKIDSVRTNENTNVRTKLIVPTTKSKGFDLLAAVAKNKEKLEAKKKP